MNTPARFAHDRDGVLYRRREVTGLDSHERRRLPEICVPERKRFMNMMPVYSDGGFFRGSAVRRVRLPVFTMRTPEDAIETRDYLKNIR